MYQKLFIELFTLEVVAPVSKGTFLGVVTMLLLLQDLRDMTGYIIRRRCTDDS